MIKLHHSLVVLANHLLSEYGKLKKPTIIHQWLEGVLPSGSERRVFPRIIYGSNLMGGDFKSTLYFEYENIVFAFTHNLSGDECFTGMLNKYLSITPLYISSGGVILDTAEILLTPFHADAIDAVVNRMIPASTDPTLTDYQKALVMLRGKPDQQLEALRFLGFLPSDVNNIDAAGRAKLNDLCKLIFAHVGGG